MGTDQYLPDMYYRRGLAVSLPFLTGYLVPRDLRLYHQILLGFHLSKIHRSVPTDEHSLLIHRSDYKCNTGSGSVPSFPIDVSGTHLQ